MKIIISLLLMFQVQMACFAQIIVNDNQSGMNKIKIKSATKDYKFRKIGDKRDIYDNTGAIWNRNDSTHYTYFHNYSVLETKTLLWDMFFWSSNSREIYTYDENYNVLTDEYQFWDGADWTGYIKNVFTYNSENLVVSNTTLNYDNSSMLWVPGGRTINEYNSKNEQIVCLIQGASSGSWTNIGRFIYFYDDSSNLISRIYQNWDNSNTWKNSSKYNFTYNSLNLKVSDTLSSWNTTSSAWDYNNLSTYEYNTSGKQIRSVEYVRVSSPSYWKASSRLTAGYDTNMNQLWNISEIWDNTLSRWTGSSKNIYTYDPANNLLTNITQLWESSTSTWYNNCRYENTYDVNNNRILFTEMRWNASVWQNFYKRVYTYDANNNEILNEYFGWGSSDWTPIDRQFSYYESFDEYSGINTVINPEKLRLFPNPASNYLFLESNADINSVTVFTSAGTMISAILADEKKVRLDVTGFEPGLYFVRIKTSQGIKTGHFSIVR